MSICLCLFVICFYLLLFAFIFPSCFVLFQFTGLFNFSNFLVHQIFQLFFSNFPNFFFFFSIPHLQAASDSSHLIPKYLLFIRDVMDIEFEVK